MKWYIRFFMLVSAFVLSAIVSAGIWAWVMLFRMLILGIL